MPDVNAAQSAPGPSLFDPLRIGRLTMPNRCVVSSLSRARCGRDGVPNELMATYFAQRAGAGLIITGSSRVAPMGAGGMGEPGLHNDEQVAGWRIVTDAVHAAGGRIFAQIYFGGSSSHSNMLPDGAQTVSPSGVNMGGFARTFDGKVPRDPPRALATHEVVEIIEQFGAAAKRAIDGGCDGVDIHACSGYLAEEFLYSATNRRTDRYGGSLTNRARYILEAFESCAGAIGRDRVGIKISPEFNKEGVVVDERPKETFAYLVRELSRLQPCYLHVADNSLDFDYHAYLRPMFDGPYFAGVGFAPERARAMVASGGADAITFGRLYIANPDLAERVRLNAVLNPLDLSTIYAAGPRGLIDYPSLAAATTAPDTPAPPRA